LGKKSPGARKMLLNIEKAYPEIVKEISVSRFRQDHLSYEFISEAILKDKLCFSKT
jgi:hypothetical protein